MTVYCGAGGTCQGGAICEAPSCKVTCDGPGSCACMENGALCAISVTGDVGVVECLGMGSCNGAVTCTATESCSVACNEAFGGCQGGVVCDAPETFEACP